MFRDSEKSCPRAPDTCHACASAKDQYNDCPTGELNILLELKICRSKSAWILGTRKVLKSQALHRD
jgi:hypothetical protein